MKSEKQLQQQQHCTCGSNAGG